MSSPFGVKNGLIFQVLKNAIFRPQIWAVFSGPDFWTAFLVVLKKRPYFQDRYILIYQQTLKNGEPLFLVIFPYIQKSIYFEITIFSIC